MRTFKERYLVRELDWMIPVMVTSEFSPVNYDKGPGFDLRHMAVLTSIGGNHKLFYDNANELSTIRAIVQSYDCKEYIAAIARE